MATCTGCHEKIKDRFYFVIKDSTWHVDCLECCQCRKSLQYDPTCFSRDGKLYCKIDFFRKFADRTCNRCLETITVTDMVVRLGDLLYHVNCFSCDVCNVIIRAGQPFQLRRRFVYCQYHARFPNCTSGIGTSQRTQTTGKKATKTTQQSPGGRFNWMLPDYSMPECGSTYTNSDILNNNNTDIIRQILISNNIAENQLSGLSGKVENETEADEKFRMETAEKLTTNLEPFVESAEKSVPALTTESSASVEQNLIIVAPLPRRRGRPRKKPPTAQQINTAGADFCQIDTGITYCSNTDATSCESRRKRMRSSFKQNQLKIMKAYFCLNQNPDAKDLKEIADKTGLLARVIQVWFQNTRAKYRRALMHCRSGASKRYQRFTDSLLFNSPEGFTDHMDSCSDSLTSYIHSMHGTTECEMSESPALIVSSTEPSFKSLSPEENPHPGNNHLDDHSHPGYNHLDEHPHPEYNHQDQNLHPGYNHLKYCCNAGSCHEGDLKIFNLFNPDEAA